MRKTLWIVAFLFVAIAVPAARAQTEIAVTFLFESGESCCGNPVIPNPVQFITTYPSQPFSLDVFWNIGGAHLSIPMNFFNLKDTYTWTGFCCNEECPPILGCPDIQFFDISSSSGIVLHDAEETGIVCGDNFLPCFANAGGPLRVAPTPEPNSAILMLTGAALLGLLLVMRKH
jgi:hypothetical protein